MYNFKIRRLSRRGPISLLFTLVAFAFASNPAACLGANPFITSIYTADPSAHVWSDGRLYVYPSHDMDPAVGCNNMDRYHVFSTADMVNWRDEGEVVQASGVPWSFGPWKFMWAPDCAYKNGTYYFYFPHPSDTSDAGWGSSWKIGVATSIEPAKGFTNVGYIPGLGGDGMIDPAVFEDTDGQFYIYEGGGGNCAGAKLKPNMVEIDGPVQTMTNLVDFHEATWVFKRNNIYYLTYADNFVTNNAQHNRMRYATSTQPLGPWTYQGVYLDVTDCDTTHGSVVEYKGQWYQFYHNHAISGTGILRSMCVDLLTFDANGNINMVVQTTTGPPSVGPAPAPATNTITYGVTNATVMVASVVSDSAAWGGKCVQNLHLTGSYVEFDDVDGGTGGEATIDIGFANGSTLSKLDMTVNGSDYSYLNTLPTGGWSTFTGDSTLTVPLQPGKTNVIRLTGGNGGVNPDYLKVTPLPPNPWNAQIASDAGLGVRTNRFGFNVMGDNWACVVETCTNLANPVWTPVVTNLIVGGVTNPSESYFSDPQWTNSPGRYYRLRTP
jgi:hypothetical protein